MVDLMHCLTNLLFFDIPLSYYYKLNSSIISCHSSGDMYLFCGASISSFCNSIECNSDGDIFETLVILTAILLGIKSLVASAVF